MPSSTLPSDASSLLVPVHLSAWSVNEENQEQIAWYQASYPNLADFQPVMDAPFSVGSTRPASGVYIQWSLPDALTHGREADDGSGVQFPLVPNRWLVARFSVQNNVWGGKLWVVQSDYVPTQQAVGALAAAMPSNNYTSLTLSAPGATVAIASGTTLQIASGDPNNTPTITTTEDVAIGDTTINIEPAYIQVDLPAGASVALPGTSNFMDPSQVASMEVDPTTTTTTINVAAGGLGQHYTIDAWEAMGDPGGALFLQAVAPGNVTFSAFAPQIQDVFAFVDTDVANNPQDATLFTYLVVGWYSDAANADPLRGLSVYLPGIWKSEAAWAAQSVTQRFQTLLNAHRWSVDNPTLATPPTTTLYHGMVVDAQWPPDALTAPDLGNSSVQVVVGNTAIDALSQLVQTYADSQPTDQTNWQAAGTALAELLQAAQYDLLDEYGQPGGQESIDQQVHNAWFGSQPGGTVWATVNLGATAAGARPLTPTLTSAQQAALDAALATLNTDQANLDQMARQLQTTQSNLFMMWWKTAQADTGIVAPIKKSDWTKVVDYLNKTGYPGAIAAAWQQCYNMQQAQLLLPNPTDAAAANQWANQAWTFPGWEEGKTVTMAELGLRLKATTAPRYWSPNDPVVLISGLNRAQVSGEDGRHSSDGKLRCRLPGETITGLTISGQPAITAAGLASAVNLNPTASYTQVPGISNLAAEAFLTDPANAAIMATAVGGDEATINSAITALITQQTPAETAAWVGTKPVPFAIVDWEQAWIPLFLEWTVNYYPTGSGIGAQHQFAMSDWTFNGTDYTWNGTGFSPDAVITSTARTFLTPHAPQVFKAKLEKYLQGHALNLPELQPLLSQIGNWDVLSQSLSGWTGQLLTRLQQETFVPPGTVPPQYTFPNPTDGGDAPSIAALVGQEYHAIPMLTGTAQAANFFNPIRAGFLEFSQLQVVDAFGQVYPFQFVQGAEPIPAEGLVPTNPPANFPDGMIQLPPRFVQGGRLNFDWLANDGSGQTTTASSNSNAICGWLLPNHLDGGISIYDQNGILLGELLGPPATVAWRPRPGLPGAVPPPASPADIANETLRNVVTTLAGQMSNFGDFLEVLDATLWMVDPLGGRQDQMLSAFIGRPLAVVQAQLSADLYGDPASDQMWDSILDSSTGKPVTNIGEIASIPIPVALGNLQLRNDGLIGYFLPGTAGGNTPYAKFYSVSVPTESNTADTFIQPILTTSGGTSIYQGDVTVQYTSPPVVVTMIVDPRGCVHAASGLFPTVSQSLPPSVVESFIQTLNVTFSVGPLLADPGIMSLPKPAEDRGAWAWIQAASPDGAWLETRITNATDQARLSDQPPVIQEGWLALSGLGKPPAS